MTTLARPAGWVPWMVPLVIGVGLSLLTAFAAYRTAFAVPFLVALVFLAWRFGFRRGLWYLFVATIPLRQPLGVDLVGSTTLFYGDVLLYVQFGIALWERGLPGVWRRSPTLRVGVIILALSVLGLYSASSLVQGVAQIQRIVGQLMTLCLVRWMVRDGREAFRVLVAFLVGLLPAVAYGLWQSTIPVSVENFPQWADVPIAHDASGRAHVRVFSTFDNSLRFSHALSTAFGLGLGLIASPGARRARWPLAAIVIAVAVCNQYTYSLSGVLAMAGALGLTAVLVLRRRAVLAAPLGLALVVALAPNAVWYKAAQMLAGESTSSMARVVTYRRTMMVLADRPLTGLGWGSVGETVARDYRISRLESVGVGAENWFLHRGLVLGIPGLLLYAALVGIFVRNVRRSRAGGEDGGWPRRALVVGGAAWFAQAMLYPTAGFAMNYLLWLLLGLAESMREATSFPGTPAHPAATARAGAIERPTAGGAP